MASGSFFSTIKKYELSSRLHKRLLQAGAGSGLWEPETSSSRANADVVSKPASCLHQSVVKGKCI